MTSEERPPTEAELREAELLARALEDAARPGDEVGPVEDALGAAWLLRASHRAELTELRARAVLERAWPRRRRRWLDPTPGRMAALGAAAAVAAILSALPRGPANLPPPPIPLLRAQLAAARPGTPELGRLEAEMSAYREQVYVALGRTYGKPR
jgi:hypothetical protein